MSLPEVILDRWVRTQAAKQRAFSTYRGRLDLDRVEQESFRSLLDLLYRSMNEALRLEGPNASDGVGHPPFHFDFLDVSDETRNAHAFQHEGFSFIAVTLPLVELLIWLSRDLSRSQRFCGLLGVVAEKISADAFHGFLAQSQVNFLVSHEYTHHIHRHNIDGSGSGAPLWTEFADSRRGRSLLDQARELDADGYAVYIVLSHLLRGERRGTALKIFSPSDLPLIDGDQLLLTCFLTAVMTFFCAFWGRAAGLDAIRNCSHPPASVRIKYVIEVAIMRCGQNQSLPSSWFNSERLSTMFQTAREIFSAEARQDWNLQMSLLKEPEGVIYDAELFEAFESVRKS